jgi:lactoylglutathione lyase
LTPVDLRTEGQIVRDSSTPPFIARAHGIILFTERFSDCVRFYRDMLGLPLWFEKPGLVCLRFGDGYLMVETDGAARDRPKRHDENPAVLRFNVDDVTAAAEALGKRGVAVQLHELDWGTIGIFHDPDGNQCELLLSPGSRFERV